MTPPAPKADSDDRFFLACSVLSFLILLSTTQRSLQNVETPFECHEIFRVLGRKNSSRAVPSGRVLAVDGLLDLSDDGLVLQQLVDEEGQDARLVAGAERQEGPPLEPLGHAQRVGVGQLRVARRHHERVAVHRQRRQLHVAQTVRLSPFVPFHSIDPSLFPSLTSTELN